jgi:hypothetical protein
MNSIIKINNYNIKYKIKINNYNIKSLVNAYYSVRYQGKSKNIFNLPDDFWTKEIDDWVVSNVTDMDTLFKKKIV